jgi:cytokinin riboside 5'-monophosphate phosphoribohydrolase
LRTAIFLPYDRRYMKICVFCSSSDAVDGAYRSAAEEMGALIGARGHTMVYGGGRVGLMGAAAAAARNAGARVIGIIPQFMNRPGVPDQDCDELIFTKDMRERKARMMDMSDAFVALPGGFGTLEELSEVITQKQFDFLKGPLVAVNTGGFYDHLAAFFEKFYEHRFAKPAFRATCAFVADPAAAMTYISGYTPPAPTSKWFTPPA